jgi:small GTP-binding protein
MVKCLLDHENYYQTISSNKETALFDYELIQQEISAGEDVLRALSKSFKEKLNKVVIGKSSSKANKAEKATRNQLSEIYQRLAKAKATDFEHLQQTLEAKKRSVGNFTIAMMGRTKAGKSTLFATLLGTYYEGIGEGKQRTTRQNKVYDIGNGIRLIDTPGIGAVGGEADEREALKAVDESDLICYVVTNDSTQETEFEFLGKLKQQTKPLLILINVQYNLKDERRLPIFLKKAEEMLTGKDIQGHKERIARYAREHYANDSIIVMPVMLLAAQLSRQSDDMDLSKKLYETSQIQTFLDHIKNIIENYGRLITSQTLLGEAAVSITSPLLAIREEIKTGQAISNQLFNSNKELQEKLGEAKQDATKQIETGVNEIFQLLINVLPSFARKHWESSPKEQENAWKYLLNSQIRVSERLENLLREVELDYKNKVEEALEEIGRDIQFLMELNSQNFNFSGVDGGFDFRTLFNIGGILLTLGGVIAFFAFTPLSPVLLVAGPIVSLFKNLFQSKEKRQQEICEKIEKSFKREIKNQKKKILASVQNEFYKASTGVERNLDIYFNNAMCN